MQAFYANPELSFMPGEERGSALAWVRGAGFDGAELLLEGDLSSAGAAAAAARCAEEVGLRLQAHAPFSDLNIAAPRPEVRRTALAVLAEAADLAACMGSPVLTVHPGHLTPLARRFKERAYHLMVEALGELGDAARARGVDLLVENMPYPNLSFCASLDQLREVAGRAGVGVCVDVGHAHVAGANGEVAAALALAGSVHFHDNHGRGRDEHLPPGEGSAPLIDALQSLHRSGYAGPVVFEMRSEEDGIKALRWWRDREGRG